MSIIEKLELEIRNLFAQDVLTSNDVARIGRLEQQLARAYAQYDV